MQKISQDCWQTIPLSYVKGIQGLNLASVQACKIEKEN
jgi:hypothetical protein